MKEFEKMGSRFITWGEKEYDFMKIPLSSGDNISKMYSVPTKDILIIETKYDRKFILFADTDNPINWILRELIDDELYSIQSDLENKK